MEKKKRPIYLWILLVLSSLSSLNGLFGLFKGMQKVDPSQIRELYKSANLPEDSINQAVTFTQKSAEASQNILTYLFPIIFVAILVAVWFFFLKREIAKANFTYLAYLLVRIVQLIYGYVVTMGLANSIFTDDNIRLVLVLTYQITTFIFFGIYVIFIGLVLYKIWRQNRAIEEE